MRIAVLVYLAPRKLGSLEQWVLGFLSECIRRGHRPHLFCLTPLHPAVLERLADIGAEWSDFQELERHPVRWGRKLRREFDLIYMNLVVPRSPGAYAAYAAWPCPVLLFNGISGPMPGDRRPRAIGRILDPMVGARLTALGGCSEYVLARDLARFRMSPTRGRVMFNGVDTARFAPGEPAASGPPVIAAVARLIPEKGIDRLLRASVQLLDLPWRLQIVGDGAEEERLRALSRSLGLDDRVEFLGLRDDVHLLLRAATIYAHPCVWEEAFGLTIAEAMASGCAVVASRVGGIPEVIEDGRSGMLVEAGNVEQLTAVLRGLLLEPERARVLGQNARRRAVERFGLDAAVNVQVDWVEEWAPRQRGSAGSPGK